MIRFRTRVDMVYNETVYINHLANFSPNFLNGVLTYLAKFSPGKITQKSEISYYQTALHWGRGL